MDKRSSTVPLRPPIEALFPSCAGIIDYFGTETSLSNTRLYGDRSKLPEKQLKFARVMTSGSNQLFPRDRRLNQKSAARIAMERHSSSWLHAEPDDKRRA
jgi:hypothetical protein